MPKTITLEDKGQDFVRIKVADDGALDGYSPIFSDGRLTLLGIGTLNGSYYRTSQEILSGDFEMQPNLYLYFKNTKDPDPLPWRAPTFKYEVKEVSDD